MATYSFIDVQAAITGPGGAFTMGSGDGISEEGISIERSEDKNNMVLGADGSIMHSLHAGSPGTILVRVLKTSPLNAVLEAMYNLQRLSSAVWGQNVITIANLVTGDVMTATFVAFKRHPVITYAKDGGMNEWAFDAGSIDGILGISV